MVESNIRNHIEAKSLLGFALPSVFTNKEVIVAKVEELLDLCSQLEDQITTNQVNTEQLMKTVLNEVLQPQ